MVYPPLSIHLLACGYQLGSLPCFPAQPPLRCAQPSLVLQWFLGGEEIVIMVFHVIHLHVPGPFCPQELLSFREQHAKESEQTGWWNSTREREKEKNKIVTRRLEVLDNMITQDLGDGFVI